MLDVSCADLACISDELLVYRSWCTGLLNMWVHLERWLVQRTCNMEPVLGTGRFLFTSLPIFDSSWPSATTWMDALLITRGLLVILVPRSPIRTSFGTTTRQNKGRLPIILTRCTLCRRLKALNIQEREVLAHFLSQTRQGLEISKDLAEELPEHFKGRAFSMFYW